MTSWLDLLLDDASADALARHHDELRASGGDPVVDRDAHSALRLRSLLDQRRQRATELAALNDIARRLATLHDPDDLVGEVVGQARRLLGVDLTYLALVEDDHLRIDIADGALTPHLLGLSIPLDTGIAAAVVARGEPVWTADYRADPDISHDAGADRAATAENIRGLLGVPLGAHGRVFGALLACKRQERSFSEDEIALLSALAAHAAVAIDNARSAQASRATVDRLERTLHWDRRLTRVVLDGGGVDDLLGEVTASAADEVVFACAGERPPVHADVLRPVLDALDGTSTATLVGDLLVQPVIAGRRVLGALVLAGSAEPSADDRLLLERAAPALALVLVGQEAVERADRLTRDAHLLDLLSRPAVDAARQLRGAGLDAARTYSVLVARPSTPAARSLLLAALPEGSAVAVEGGRLLAAVPVDDPEALAASWDDSAGLTAGIAGPAAGAGDLARCRRQAEQALDALVALGRTGGLTSAEGLGVYQVLLSQQGRQNVRGMVDRELGAVLAEERQRSVPLVRTLHAFLDHGRRPAAAATELGVHVNTLYQRLAVIDRLLGQNWREPDRALDLHLLLRLNEALPRLRT
ncbi:GAF domain-containing protein [Umezawaea sp. Da 62-37]|uniref:helix-turn-helix domain-containing protein n=1 Tax=Umezawaea sp. Da 62-37 TaxID=3075927 RepID=UPI0028F72C17|nr:GAF domain-containing protein [Umezawaea sp. Da 62-37]WNV87081.1 GAF domain-containing protein [Umezawaea sp. Da 62-37]